MLPQVDIPDERYFTVRRDEEGFERWLAVKRIPWDQITPNRGRLEKVRDVTLARSNAR